jgi:hypothetical protein
MKQSIQISALIIFTLLVVFPRAAMSETKISLKNGRSIIADTCSEANGKLVCDKMGGTFEFDKDDILNIEEITIERSALPESRTETTEPEVSDEKKEMENKTPEAIDAPKPAEGVLIKGLSPEADKRLDEIKQKKDGLRKEREKLVEEREQLREEIKNAGVMRYGEKLDALQKRINDLGEKINRFNEEANNLNEEENRIFKESEKTK